MTSRKLAFTALALVLPLAAACGVEPDVEDIDGPEAETASVPNPNPILIEGNPTCADLGYEFEAKVDFPPDGNPYTFTLFGGDTITFTHDGYYIDWSSTLGIDVVLVKGGPRAYAWTYSPEATSGADLYSPLNDGGNLAAISHVNFCFDYEVEVEKTALPTYERQYFWDIEKTGSATELLLSVGQVSPLVGYTVDVLRTGFEDTDFAVGGTITVRNPAPIAATVTGVTDAFGDLAIPVACSKALPATLEPLEVMTCTYAAELPGLVEGTNVATVTTIGKVGGGEATALVDFGEPTTLTDECVTVTDTFAGELGVACGNATYTYDRSFGPYAVCDETHTEVNVATFVTNDTGATGSDDHTVVVTVPACDLGCTLTQGYWKTHSVYGPAPYDDTWEGLAGFDEDTRFFTLGGALVRDIGLSYQEMMWTPPKGSAYVKLAHQYIAAKLNVANGADPTAITVDPNDVMSAVEALFTNNPPSMVEGKTALAKKMTYIFNFYAQVLDEYNNGLRGPGHCSE